MTNNNMQPFVYLWWCVCGQSIRVHFQRGCRCVSRHRKHNGAAEYWWGHGQNNWNCVKLGSGGSVVKEVDKVSGSNPQSMAKPYTPPAHFGDGFTFRYHNNKVSNHYQQSREPWGAKQKCELEVEHCPPVDVLLYNQQTRIRWQWHVSV